MDYSEHIGKTRLLTFWSGQQCLAYIDSITGNILAYHKFIVIDKELLVVPDGAIHMAHIADISIPVAH